MQQIGTFARRLAGSIQVVSLLVLLLATCTMRAQIAGAGNIQGVVTDATGAVVAHGTVTLTDEATQVAHTTQTDASGAYAFPNATIGTYTVSVSVPGFETYVKTGNVLEVGSNIAINVTLTVGRADQKVEVHADSLALQTEDVSFKQTIDQTAVTEMPLNGRQMTGLITLSGGASAAPGGDFSQGSKYSYAAIAVSIAGGMGNTTSWKLDGGDNNDYMANSNLPFPFPDAVSQFSVESTALGAQSGMHSGGLVNVVTRSGTNAYHGSAFEFIRNNYLDATNFFVLPCVPVPPLTHCTTKDTLHQDEYGGTFGGKILRDKLFAFAGFQYHHAQQSSATSSAYVPTAANLAGDFSTTDPAPVASGGTGVANSCSGVEQLYDPITGATLPGNKYPTPPAFNAASLKLLAYLPKIVPLTDGSDACGHVQYAIPSLVNYKQFVTRVDYTINSKNNLYARYFLDGYQSPAPFIPTNILYTTASGNIERVQTWTAGEAYVISSKIVNSAHVTVSRRSNNRGYNPADINLGNLGVTAYQLEPNGLQLTSTTSGKNHGFTIGGGTNSVSHFNDNALALSDDVTMVEGRHQFVFGGEFVRNQLNISNAYETNGVGTITGIYSSNGPTGTGACVTGTPPAATACAVGDANLDFLAGAENQFQQSKQQQNALRGSIPSIYFQDTFHASKKITIVAGLRWSPEFFPHDYFNRGSIFDMARFLANKTSSVFPNAPAGTFFYGDTGVSKAFTQSSPWQFSPNVGVSWDPQGNGKTVLRAGMEVAYDEVNFFTGQRVNQNPPFATASNPATGGQLCFSNPWLVGGTGAGGCGQTGGTNVSPYPTPQIPTPATALFPAQGQYIVLPTQFHPSDTLQYTASIQRELPHGWQLQLDYIGNRTKHAPIGLPLDNAIFVPGQWGANGTGCTGLVTTGPAAVKPGLVNSNCSTTGNQNSRFALTVANPQQGNQYLGGGGGSILVGDSAIGNYNGLVTTVQHRLSSTFSVLANWTWSKCLNEADAQGDLAAVTVEDPTNPRLDYAPCGSDYRHIENLTMVAISKFGFPNRIEKALLNNWEFAPLVHIVSGAPFTVTQGADESLTDNGSGIDRANVVQGQPVYLHIANRQGSGAANRAYLNPAAFVNNGVLGTFGNASRNAYRGLPAYQFDAQVSRIFPIHERLNLDLRLEAFNALNHPNFSNPSSSNPGTATAPNSTFGQISATSNNARVFQGGIKLSF